MFGIFSFFFSSTVNQKCTFIYFCDSVLEASYLSPFSVAVNLIFCFPNFTFLFYFSSCRFVRSFLVRSEFLLFLNSIFGVISFLKFWSGSNSELFLNSLKFCFVVPVGFSVGNYGCFEINKVFIGPGLRLIARFVLFHVLCV